MTKNYFLKKRENMAYLKQKIILVFYDQIKAHSTILGLYNSKFRLMCPISLTSGSLSLGRRYPVHRYITVPVVCLPLVDLHPHDDR